MISNFSEVEKSLKRCLKEKVSITAATVVGFLIAGTVAFGEAKDVTFTTVNEGGVTVTVKVGSTTTTVEEATDSISVEQYEALTTGEGALAGLLTVTTEGGVTTFAGAGEALGTVSAKATENGELTLIKTDETNTSITSSLKIEAEGDATAPADVKKAIAMEATNAGDKVASTGEITVNAHAVGMKANAGATAVNEGKITVTNADGVGMLANTADGKTTTLTNNGTIDAGAGIGMTTDDMVKGAIAKLTNNKTITVTTGKGIVVKGAGTVTVDGTGTIEVTGTGTGIDATGNVTVDGAKIALGAAATGTGIKYVGGTTKAEAEISTGDIDITAAGTGINATLSSAVDSDLKITTGIISTGDTNAFGIKIAGTAASEPQNEEKPSTATVATTLGETKGTGVSVAGEVYNDITVNLEGTTEGAVTGTGVEITANKANGKVVVNVDQSNLSVADEKELVKVTANAGDVTIDAKQAVKLLDGANLVNVAANEGTLTVNLDAVGQSVATGSLVNVGAITGTTNVNINQDVVFGDTKHAGTIVKAGAVTGALNVNLNVKEGSLNVTAGNTAINLEAVNENNVASVKNTGNVTIEEKGTLVAGNDKSISLTNQGLITLKTVSGKDESKDNNSVISKGKGVTVANYGTITLKDMDSKAFLKKAGEEATLKTLTLNEVKSALVSLGVIEGTDFTSVGYIKFSDGELFTTAKELSGNESIENLIHTAEQEGSDRAFSVTKDGLTLTSTGENAGLSNVQFNLNGTMKIDGTENEVIINNAGHDNQINIEKEGKLEIAKNAKLNYSGNILASEEGTAPAITIEDGGTLTLSNGTLTVGPLPAEKNEYGVMSIDDKTNRVGIKLAQDAKTLVLDNSIINADIEGSLSGTELKNEINSKGISAINGTVTDIKDIKVTENGMLKFGANSTIVSTATGTTKETTIDLTAGKMGVQIGENGNNVLKNSTLYDSEKEIKFTGTSQDGKVVLLTDALTENTKFDLGNHTDLKAGDITVDGDIYYTLVKGEGNNWNATFNEDALLKATGTKYLELNNMYIATQAIHDLLAKDPNVRAAQLDDLYSNNIYSETVKMSLDTLKMNEDAVLSLNVRPKQGEFTAQGKFLFNNTDYDREGVTRDYKVETKNTGLLGAMEYGLTDTSSVGFAFSGTKQDLDMKNGASADGDAFYFGLYRNDTFNNIDLTTGLGYMIDRVDAENFIGKDKFDSTALSGYIQGKYNYAIGENLTLSPKARLTVTRFQQDSINTGRMKQEEIKDTMADLELGVELKKGIVLETGKMNLLAGASYTTNVAGKDDDFYRVDFLSKTGKANSTRAKGANLEKNSLKLNIGADVELTNGVFYNGGLSYEFDDEDRDSIGVTLGAGYKF